MPPPVSRVADARPSGRPGRVERYLSAPGAPLLVIALAFVLSLPSLTFGFSVDEYFQVIALSGDERLQGFARAPWDLFTFSRPEYVPQLREEGIFPWWTDPQSTISFFRPFTSLTLFADHKLWGQNVPLFHLHSLVWYVLLLGSVWCVYREFELTAKLPALALFLYALDDARGQVTGWISLRNASIALIPGALVLVAHHRWRRGAGAKYGLFAPILLALALAGGEVAVAVFGYLLAYAAFMDRGPLVARLRSLLPYLLVLAPYRLIYNAYGYGALHSGLYVDPVREPLAFLSSLVTHLPVLLFAQFAPLPSELWEPIALISPWLKPAVLMTAVLGLAALARLLWPLLRDSAEARFWALGSVLSTIPFCATFPADRLLVATSLGGAALLGQLLLLLFDATRTTRARRLLGYALVAVHCVLSPLYFAVRSRDLVLTERLLARADRSIANTPALADKTVIMLNPALCPLGTYFPVYRAAHHGELPAAFRYLADGESPLRVERVDEHTLRLRPEAGFLSSASQRVFRRQRPFQQGERIALSDMSITVSELRADGRPAEVLVQLDKPLEDPSLQWLRWGERAYVPFALPKLGESVVLPKVDAIPLLFADSDG